MDSEAFGLLFFVCIISFLLWVWGKIEGLFVPKYKCRYTSHFFSFECEEHGDVIELGEWLDLEHWTVNDSGPSMFSPATSNTFLRQERMWIKSCKIHGRFCGIEKRTLCRKNYLHALKWDEVNSWFEKCEDPIKPSCDGAPN